MVDFCPRRDELGVDKEVRPPVCSELARFYETTKSSYGAVSGCRLALS